MNSFRVPYEVKASKFLSFSTLAASLPFNRASQRQKIAQPSAFKSLRLAGPGGLGRGARRAWHPGSCHGHLVPSTASRAGEGDSSDRDSSDIALQEATSQRCHRVRCPSRGCSGMGSGHWSAPFPSWLWEGSELGRAWGAEVFPERRGEVLGAAGWVRMGAGQSRATFS